MTIRQAKRDFGMEGTKKSRKQWSIALLRGRVPNKNPRLPNFKKLDQ